MIPLRDDRPPRTFAFATASIVVLNVAVFIHELSLGSSAQQEAFFASFALTPADLIRTPSPGTFRTIFTSMFLHGGWAHILGNMLFLAIFGKNVEDAFGRLGYLALYFAGGFVAMMTQTAVTLLFDPASDARVPTLGASGAIAAVLGAYFVLYPTSRVLTLVFWFPVWVPAWLYLGGWFLYQFFESNYSLRHVHAGGGGVAFFAHVGGFVFGFIVARLLLGSGLLTVAGTRQELSR